MVLKILSLGWLLDIDVKCFWDRWKYKVVFREKEWCGIIDLGDFFFEMINKLLERMLNKKSKNRILEYDVYGWRG